MSADPPLAGQAPRQQNELKAQQASNGKDQQSPRANGAPAMPLSLDAFMARYVACPDERQRRRALEAAWGVLSRPASQEEPLLNLKEISAHYHVHPSTAWRWGLPYREWRGAKRYIVSECDAYFQSDAFRQRRYQPRVSRQEEEVGSNGAGDGGWEPQKRRGRRRLNPET